MVVLLFMVQEKGRETAFRQKRKRVESFPCICCFSFAFGSRQSCAKVPDFVVAYFYPLHEIAGYVKNWFKPTPAVYVKPYSFNIVSVLSDLLFFPLHRCKMIPCIFSFSLLLMKSSISSYVYCLGNSITVQKQKTMKLCWKPLKKWKDILCKYVRIVISKLLYRLIATPIKILPVFVELGKMTLNWI